MPRTFDFVKPEDKETLEKLLAAYPQLAEDNSPELQAKIDSMLGDYNDWKKWHDEAYPLAQAWEAENVKLKAELEEMKAAQAKNGGGKAADDAAAAAATAAAEAAKKAGAPGAAPSGSSQEELLAKLQAGFISKSEIEDMKTSLSNDILQKARDAFWKDIYPGMSSTLLGINESGVRFASEFPAEKWDRADFLKFAKENNISDVGKAYDSYVADRRHKVEIKAAVDKALAEERAKIEQQHIPGAAPARPQDLGLLERRARNVKPDVQIPEGATLGNGQLARLAAEEFHREGKTELDTQRGAGN